MFEFLTLEVIKNVLLGFIFIIAILFQLFLFFDLFRHRKEVHFVSAVLRPEDGTISKGGVAFFIIILIIIYQALFMKTITPGLVELMGVIIGGDVAGKAVEAYKSTKFKQAEVVKEIADEEDTIVDDFKKWK